MGKSCAIWRIRETPIKLFWPNWFFVSLSLGRRRALSASATIVVTTCRTLFATAFGVDTSRTRTSTVGLFNVGTSRTRTSAVGLFNVGTSRTRASSAAAVFGVAPTFGDRLLFVVRRRPSYVGASRTWTSFPVDTARSTLRAIGCRPWNLLDPILLNIFTLSLNKLKCLSLASLFSLVC